MTAMKRVLLRALAAGACMTVLSLSESVVMQANASPSVVGQTDSDAATALNSAGFTPVISTTVGDRLPRAQCLVTAQQDRKAQAPPNSGGSATNQTLISLNCNAAVATATSPGNSLASPAGRAAAAAAATSAASQ